MSSSSSSSSSSTDSGTTAAIVISVVFVVILSLCLIGCILVFYLIKRSKNKQSKEYPTQQTLQTFQTLATIQQPTNLPFQDNKHNSFQPSPPVGPPILPPPIPPRPVEYEPIIRNSEKDYKALNTNYKDGNISVKEDQLQYGSPNTNSTLYQYNYTENLNNRNKLFSFSEIPKS